MAAVEGGVASRVAERHRREPFALRVPGLGQQLLSQLGVVVGGVLLKRLTDGKRVALHQVPVGGDRQRCEQSLYDRVAVAGMGEGLPHLQVVEGRGLGLEKGVVDPEVLRVDVQRQLLEPSEVSASPRPSQAWSGPAKCSPQPRFRTVVAEQPRQRSWRSGTASEACMVRYTCRSAPARSTRSGQTSSGPTDHTICKSLGSGCTVRSRI